MTDYIFGIDFGANDETAFSILTIEGAKSFTRIAGYGTMARKGGALALRLAEALTFNEGDTIEVRYEPAPVKVYSLYSDGQGFEFFASKAARDTALTGPRWSRVLRACVHLDEHAITADNLVEVLTELTGQAHG